MLAWRRKGVGVVGAERMRRVVGIKLLLDGELMIPRADSGGEMLAGRNG